MFYKTKNQASLSLNPSDSPTQHPRKNMAQQRQQELLDSREIETLYVRLMVEGTRVVRGVNRHHCIHHKFAATKDDGSQYGQIRHNGVKYYCHVISLMFRTREISAGRQASHLCGDTRCINPDHLCWESDRVNKTRWCCFDNLGIFPGYVCPHFPACFGH